MSKLSASQAEIPKRIRKSPSSRGIARVTIDMTPEQRMLLKLRAVREGTSLRELILRAIEDGGLLAES